MPDVANGQTGAPTTQERGESSAQPPGDVLSPDGGLPPAPPDSGTEPAPVRQGIGDGESGTRSPASPGGSVGGASAPAFGAGGGTAVGGGAAAGGLFGGGVVGAGGVGGAGSGSGSLGGASGAGGLLAGTVGVGVDFGGVAGGGAAGGGVAPPPGTPIMNPVQPGQLTAGAWDDNLNYERFSAFRKSQYDAKKDGLLPFSAADFDAAHERFSGARASHQQLDVALVIDTTGSMGDEIQYLQSEFIALSSAIEQAYPDAEQRWALVVYRDTGDEYITRYFDFRDEPEAFRQKLAAQSSNGGGDFPEAPEAAFEVLNQFAWREGASVARLAFWVADAPHHTENAKKLADGIRTAQGQDIHVYPVASSGIDEFTELGMRSAAQLTGGRYLFLTDDSGIGGAHLEPSIPCYFVTLLEHAITRMVAIEMSGTYREPELSQVIRTGGDPQDGSCRLESGDVVVVF